MSLMGKSRTAFGASAAEIVVSAGRVDGSRDSSPRPSAFRGPDCVVVIVIMCGVHHPAFEIAICLLTLSESRPPEIAVIEVPSPDNECSTWNIHIGSLAAEVDSRAHAVNSSAPGALAAIIFPISSFASLM